MIISKSAIVAAALITACGTAAAVAAGPKTAPLSPGHQMQAAPTAPPHGASTFAPGHLMQDSSTTPATPGASSFAPGRQTGGAAAATGSPSKKN